MLVSLQPFQLVSNSLLTVIAHRYHYLFLQSNGSWVCYWNVAGIKYNLLAIFCMMH